MSSAFSAHHDPCHLPTPNTQQVFASYYVLDEKTDNDCDLNSQSENMGARLRCPGVAKAVRLPEYVYRSNGCGSLTPYLKRAIISCEYRGKAFIVVSSSQGAITT